MLITSLLSICKTKKIGLKMSNTCVRAKLTRQREFHNDGAATANARSPSVALDFTDSIARSRVLEPLRL